MTLSVQKDARFINQVLNHPTVRPDVADVADGVIDVSAQLASPNTLCLAGDHGGFLGYRYAIGIWEVHTAFLPSGRGEWGRQSTLEGIEYMFCATDCIDLITRVPQGHVAAAALTKSMGFIREFETPAECLFRGERVPCGIWSLSLQKWAAQADAMAVRGAALHEWMNRQIKGVPHLPDPDHNRIVGIAMAMIENGQVAKGVSWYNRWALAARHPLVTLLSLDPPSLKFDAGVLSLVDGEIRLDVAH